jgi:two-component system nitrogen regulation sensor histidine kinase NtrY
LCFLLALPALVFAGIFLWQRPMDPAPAILLVGCLLLYLALIAAALTDGIIRPLETLSNVLSSLREGDYSFRARGAGAQDALGELAGEVNALADLLQKQRVHSLEATALLARILEVMNAPLFAFDRGGLLQLVNNAGAKLLGLPQVRCFGRSAHELGLEELLAAPDQTIRSFSFKQSLTSEPARWLLRKAVFRQDGVPHTLLLLDDVSRPLQEEEQTAWKRLVRVLGHEISNSLTPIKSIAGSLRTRVNQPSCRRSRPARPAPRPGRYREPRRRAEPFRAVLPLAGPTAPAAPQAGSAGAAAGTGDASGATYRGSTRCWPVHRA